MKTERFDIHQHITDKIIAAIERGAEEFRLPWHRSAGNIMRPVNIASKKSYRGVNVLALWATAEEKGYTAGRRPGRRAPDIKYIFRPTRHREFLIATAEHRSIA